LPPLTSAKSLSGRPVSEIELYPLEPTDRCFARQGGFLQIDDARIVNLNSPQVWRQSHAVGARVEAGA